ncbi:MAG: DMT family transporter [Pseudomonadota bacterium]|nr:DMT family transporter [Pseudomonadota bacterium]
MRKKTAVSLVLLGAFFMSFNALLIRLIDSATGFQILLYRALSMSALVLLVILYKRRTYFISSLKKVDVWDLLVGLFLGVAFTTYVFSIIFTSVAASLFILSTSPLIATFLAWRLLGEIPSLSAIVAMILSLIGVFIMVYEGLVLEKNLGYFLALISALAFASMLVATRGSKKADILTGTFLGGLISGLFGLLGAIVFSSGIIVSGYDILISFVMGAFAIGLGITLVTSAAPFVPPSEVSVLVLLESFLGPVWVWLLLGESLTKNEFIGGFLIFFSVVLLAYKSQKIKS